MNERLVKHHEEDRNNTAGAKHTKPRMKTGGRGRINNSKGLSETVMDRQTEGQTGSGKRNK